VVFKAISQVQLHRNPIYAVAQDGPSLFSASSDGTVKKFNLDLFALEPFTVRTSNTCISLHVLQNGWLCLGLLNGDFHVINPQTNQELFTYSFGEKGVFSIDSSSALGQLYIGLSSGKIAVIDIDTFALLFWDTVASDKIRRVIWSWEHQRLFVSSKDGSIALFNPTSWEVEHSWIGHEMGSNALVLTKDGRCISGGKDGYIRIWGKDNWRLEHAFPAHRGVIYSMITFGNFIISASRDKSIKVWSLENYSPLQKLNGHRQSVNAIMQQNEYSFVSVSDDGSLILWSNA
jgi:WD40 repeat protein